MFFFRNGAIRKYHELRETGKIVNQDIINRFIDQRMLLQSSKLLGLLKNEQMSYRRESDSYILLDFAIHELKSNGKNAVALYKEKVKQLPPLEAEIIQAMMDSYTSLFKIIGINKRAAKLQLVDLLVGSPSPLTLLDFNLSRSAPEGLLLFTRLLPLGDFHLHAGIGLPFSAALENFLLKEYPRLAHRVKSPSPGIKKYVAFFKLHRRYGTDVYFL